LLVRILLAYYCTFDANKDNNNNCMCRDVKVFRLVSKNSIEEAILHCAEKKLKLEMDVTGSGQKGGT